MASVSSELLLDVNIRNFVLLPILFVMFSVSVLRYTLSMMFPTTPSKDLKAAYDAQIVIRVRRLLGNGGRISRTAFERRRAFFSHEKKGLLSLKALPPKDKVEMGFDFPVMDPSKMMAGQMSMVMNNLYIVTLYNTVEYFFSGFIAAKLPFALTGGFKRMLHAGIDLENLEVTYVSSSSWYLLCFSGLNQLTTVLLGAGAVLPSGLEAQMLPQLGQQGMFGGASQPHKMFEAEKKLVLDAQHPGSIVEESTRRFAKTVL